MTGSRIVMWENTKILYFQAININTYYYKYLLPFPIKICNPLPLYMTILYQQQCNQNEGLWVIESWHWKELEKPALFTGSISTHRNFLKWIQFLFYLATQSPDSVNVLLCHNSYPGYSIMLYLQHPHFQCGRVPPKLWHACKWRCSIAQGMYPVLNNWATRILPCGCSQLMLSTNRNIKEKTLHFILYSLRLPHTASHQMCVGFPIPNNSSKPVGYPYNAIKF